MYLRALAALDEASGDESLRALLFCGAGGTCTAGNDLADFLAFSGEPLAFPALRFIKALACSKSLWSRRSRATRSASA